MVGSEGINSILEIVLQIDSLSAISFDKSDVTNAILIIELFNTLASIHRIRILIKPRHDINVIADSKKVSSDLKAAWYRLSEAIKISHDDYDEDIEFSFPTSNFQSIESRSSQKCSMHMLSASWGIEDEDIEYISKSEWDKLKNHFSYARITGIK